MKRKISDSFFRERKLIFHTFFLSLSIAVEEETTGWTSCERSSRIRLYVGSLLLLTAAFFSETKDDQKKL